MKVKDIDLESLKVDPADVKEIDLGDGVLLSMARIGAGSFMMGSPEDALGYRKDEVQHRVTLTRDFWLGRFPVTQREYRAVTGKNPSEFKSEDRPVENVSWEDTKAFCVKLNELYAGRLPAGYHFDLPTEAQWEYACRAGTTTSLNSGRDITAIEDKCPNLDEVGWYAKNSKLRTQAVGRKKPNAWGLYDMHGNVWEWCRDWYGAYPDSDVSDPSGPETGSLRVNRGGSMFSCARLCRSEFRDLNDPSDRLYDLGFRLALVPVQ